MHNICEDDHIIFSNYISLWKQFRSNTRNNSEVIPMLSALFLKKLDFVKERYLLEVIPIKIKATDESR